MSCADRFRNSSTCGCRANGQRALGTRRRACGAADRSPRSGPRSLVCPRHRGHGAQRRTPSCPLRSVRRGRAPWPGNHHLPASLPELDARVFFHLEVDVRLAIAGEELANPQGRRGMGRSDQDSVASVVGDQRHPAEDERAQEDLAQLGIGLDHPPQRVRRHLQGLAVLAHPAANQGPAPGQDARLSGELARSVDRGRLLPAVDQVDDLHLAGNDDVEIARGLALVEQNGPARPERDQGWRPSWEFERTRSRSCRLLVRFHRLVPVVDQSCSAMAIALLPSGRFFSMGGRWPAAAAIRA